VEQSTSIPFKPESSVSGSFDSIMFWLLLLLVIAGLLLWVLKRLQVIQGVEKLQSDIKIKERKRISQKLSAYVIEYEEQKMMVFESQVGIQALPLDAPNIVAPKVLQEQDAMVSRSEEECRL
tara:strand:+ start:689 stop:1054 length:366 start_codon:yes stop_codon:yes gene_type:complete